MKRLAKIFLMLLWIASPLSYAQETPPQPPPSIEEQADQKKGSDFFDTIDAPVSYKGTFVKMMLTLLALIVLIVVTLWMLRRISHGRMKQMNYGRAIKVIERRPLSAKSVLYLVEIMGKKVVVAESHVNIQSITTADHLPLDET